MTVLGFVPARGGSKGIPRKNLRILGGRPLIVHTLDAARNAVALDDVFVSTDDAEIAAVCEAAGVAVPYRRPAEFAADDTPMADTVLAGLDWLAAQGRPEPELIVLLQPTSPLRSGPDIDAAVRRWREAGKGSVVSVHEMSEHPFECLRATPGTDWRPLAGPARLPARRQDYGNDERFYFINGAIYVTTPEFLRRHRIFFTPEDSTYSVMDRLRGIDIDDMADLIMAEAVLQYFGASTVGDAAGREQAAGANNGN